MEIITYILASLIGLSLGLIGGGGSIITVPVLVYIGSIDPITSTAYSLFVVGSTSLVGAYSKMNEGFVDVKTAFLFGIPSIITVYLTRAFLIPSLPEILTNINGVEITKDLGIMLLFSVVMLLASVSMIREKKNINRSNEVSPNYLLIIIEGVVVGTLTGIVGAGGGFLIIPALVLFLGLEMKKAVGTSLLIIAMKSLIGFMGDLQSNLEIDWSFLLLFSAISIAGIFIGNRLSKQIAGEKLKKAFGWFVLIMAVYILVKELYL